MSKPEGEISYITKTYYLLQKQHYESVCDSSGTYITLVGAVGFDVAAHKQTANEAVAFQRVDSRCKGQNGSLLGRGEFHLGKVVDEEVEFCGHAAQTGFDQPDKMRKSFNYIKFRNYMLDSEDLQTHN